MKEIELYHAVKNLVPEGRLLLEMLPETIALIWWPPGAERCKEVQVQRRGGLEAFAVDHLSRVVFQQMNPEAKLQRPLRLAQESEDAQA